MSLLVVGVAYFALVTYGTGKFWGVESWQSAYDSLARSMMRGESSVAPESIGWEGFERDGRVFMYFGPLPALLRIPLITLWPDSYGQWSRVSCLMAAMLSLVAVASLFRRVVRRDGIVALLILAVGFSSPLLFLISNSSIYHEAILWGLASSLWGLYFMDGLVERPNDRASFAGLSTSAGCALLSRVTFGLPLYLGLAIFTVRAIMRLDRQGRKRLAIVLSSSLLPALSALLFQCWYNVSRYGSLAKPVAYAGTYQLPWEFGGVLNFARVPDTLRIYFGVSSEIFSAVPPYVHMRMVDFLRPDLFFQWPEPILPLTLASPWLIILGVRGAWILAKERRAGVWTLIVGAFAIQALVLLG